MGLDFGFALVNDPENEMHFDKAEDDIFKRILGSLERFHLIEILVDENMEAIISTTTWGIKSLKEDMKFLFYEGNIKLNDLYLLHNSESIDNPFPFHKYNIKSRNKHNN